MIKTWSVGSDQWTDGYRNNSGTRARGLGPRGCAGAKLRFAGVLRTEKEKNFVLVALRASKKSNRYQNRKYIRRA